MFSEQVTQFRGELEQQLGAVRQRLLPDGRKPLLSRRPIDDCCLVIGAMEADLPLKICGGLATGETIGESTGTAISCAVNAGSVLPAAHYLYCQHPDAELIIAADVDQNRSGNLGRKAAVRAADMLDIGLVSPAWEDDASPDSTDANALDQWSEAGV